MLHSEIDHLVVTASSLKEGEEYVQRALGVRLQPGGQHARMGTHNSLLSLGNALYLEVIAVDPAAQPPARPRWYELDRRDPLAPPRLFTWVARVNDIEAASLASPIPLGDIEAMGRGQFNWRITVPADGGMPLQGIAPTLIQWSDVRHPASQLDDLGCSLIRLEGFHPESERIAGMLKALGFEGAFTVTSIPAYEKPYLVAHIKTPAGEREFGAP